ncbi:MAG: MFS transporter, partial [Polyangiales bacterium]
MEVASTSQRPSGRRALWAWALYDVGNSAFATTVMAGFFPLFFKRYWSADADVSRSTFHLGLATSVASLIVALTAPVLGAIADKGHARKRSLLAFALLGSGATAALCLVAKGAWLTAAIVYATAMVGFAGSLVFYDSLLLAVAAPEQTDRASALGYALGYLGGGCLFALNTLMTLKPGLFGLASPAQGVRASFPLVALWWIAFTLPLLRNVPEPRADVVVPAREAIASGLRQLRSTLRRVSTLRPVWTFLLAYWLYIDGVDTVIAMAMDFGLSLKLDQSSLIIALLVTQFVGFPAALAFGRLGGIISGKRAVLLGICVYIGVTLYAYRMRTATEFFALAVTIGLVQGGVQSLSRALYSRLIPEAEAGEFFGFYNMLAKFAAILGPALMGVVSLWTHDPHTSILSLAVLLAGGGTLLWFV